MFTASNSLSLVRAPLALLFLQEHSGLRVIAVILAMLTDSVDGYLARKTQSVSRFGAILDPVMDKFFVYFCMSILFIEHRLAPLEVAAMLSRDGFLCIYGAFMIASKGWKSIVFRSIRWGKVTTALQFIVLIGLSLNVVFPWPVFLSFTVMGWLALLELLQVKTSLV